MIINYPIDTDKFVFSAQKEDFYLISSRMISYKRLDIAIEAFNWLGLPLVITGDGPERKRLEAKALSNITFLGYVDDQWRTHLMAKAKAVVITALEDYGLVPIEANASGTPVVGYGAGGILDTQIPGKTAILYNSWVKVVCLDSELGEPGIGVWADTCRQAQKKVFLRITSSHQILDRHNGFCWRIKRFLDWGSAAILLLLLSPIMLAISLLVKLSSPGRVLFRQWRVGKRGKLFEIYKFRTMSIDAEQQHHEVMGDHNGLHKLENDPRINFLGKWLRKFSLDELPQLFNVLRGEMSLVGPRPWALYDALRLGEVGKERLNALPGITGAWQVESRSKLLDLNAVTKCDLEYLHSWSLIRDFKILLLTVPKVLSGFGAY